MLPDPLKLFDSRKVRLVIKYADKDITKDLSGSILSLTYTSNASGEADSIELSVEDRDGKWQSVWYPQTRENPDGKK